MWVALRESGIQSCWLLRSHSQHCTMGWLSKKLTQLIVVYYMHVSELPETFIHMIKLCWSLSWYYTITYMHMHTKQHYYEIIVWCMYYSKHTNSDFAFVHKLKALPILMAWCKDPCYINFMKFPTFLANFLSDWYLMVQFLNKGPYLYSIMIIERSDFWNLIHKARANKKFELTVNFVFLQLLNLHRAQLLNRKRIPTYQVLTMLSMVQVSFKC